MIGTDCDSARSQYLASCDVEAELANGRIFDDLASLAAEICQCAGAEISFIGRAGNRLCAGVAFEGAIRLGTCEICPATWDYSGLLVVPDTRKDPRFVGRISTCEGAEIRFLTCVPLRTSDGVPLGALCVFDAHPRTLSTRHHSLLKGLANQVFSGLETRRLLKAQLSEKRSHVEFLEFAGVHQWRFDFETQTVQSGPGLLEIFGLDPCATEPTPIDKFFKAVHPDDRALLSQASANTILTGQSTDVEFRIVSSEGKTRWYSSRSFANYDAHGQECALMGLTVDITYLKQAQGEREASQARLHEILKEMPASVSYWDKDLRLGFGNSKFEERTGKKAAETVGASISEVLDPGFLRENREYLCGVLDGRTQSFDVVTEAQAGYTRVTQLNLVPDMRDEEVVGFFAIGTDRTEGWHAMVREEQNQEHLRPVLDSVPVCIAYWDTSLVNRFANASYLRYFGKKRCEVEGRPSTEVIGQSLLNRNLKRINSVLNGKPQIFQKVFTAHDGTTREAIFKYVPDIKQGRVAGFFAMIVDVTDQKHAEANALQSQERLRTVVDNMPALIGYWNADLRNEFANQGYFESFGLSPEAIQGMTMEQVYGRELFQQCEPYLKMVLMGKPQTFDRTTVGEDGKVTHSQANLIPDFEKGRVKGFYILEADITDRREAELSLMEEKERGRVTLNSIGDGVITTDCEGAISYMNPKAEKMTGWSLEEARGAPIDAVLRIYDGLQPLDLTDPLERAVHRFHPGTRSRSCRIVDRSGLECEVEDSASPILDSFGKVLGTVLVLHDVSEERAMASRMAFLARHDSLTNLPNRVLLLERLELAMSAAREAASQFSVMFLDVDHFKNINDSMGHAVGDSLLRAIADRLTGAVRGCDTVSRLGGDEFILVLDRTDSAEEAAEMVRQIVRSVAVPYQIQMIDGTEFKLSITVSAGVAVYPQDGLDRDTLLRRADVAMYLAKQGGRNRFEFFSPELDREVMVRHSWLQSMREAIDTGEFRVYYQPKVSTADRRVIGVEALVRWQRSTGEMVSPGEFIPLAEKSGLIVDIGEQVLFEACRQCARWEELGLVTIPIAVNVSAVQLASPGFVDFVAGVLEKTAIHPSNLELEITESSLMADVDKAALVLYQLKELGVKVSLDDFGTGYSSLSYLRRFPLDCIKIDRSFVSDLTTNPSTAAIMKTICNLGRTLNLQIVAEGVETEAQAQLICSLNCDAMQGFLFSKPIRGEAVTRMLPYRTVFAARAA